MTRRLFLMCLLLGLAIRAIALWQTTAVGPRIVDEQHYMELATSLATGHGFAWASGSPTSLRPPLYPAAVSLIFHLTSVGNYLAVRIFQLLLGLLTTWFVYDLGRRVFSARVGLAAAAVTWLYPSMILANVTLLTESLFTCLLVAFVWLAVRLIDRPAAGTAVVCGIVLGLAALTRSVLWPLPVVLCPLLVALLWPRRGRFVLPVLVLLGYACVITPWAVRNTRLQHVITIVDTMGGMNLRMGNYEYTPEDRMWDAVSLTGEKNWVYALTQEPAVPLPAGGVFTEGMKDKWAQRKAIEYMRAHPGTTARRAAIKFGDFWGLERSFAAGVQQGLYAPPVWLAAAIVLATIASYVGVALLGGAGIWLVPTPWRLWLLLLLPIGAITAAHTIVFGHERYHLPLVPILAIFAAAVWTKGIRNAVAASWVRTVVALLTLGLFLTIWTRQILFVDGDRLRRLFEQWL